MWREFTLIKRTIVVYKAKTLQVVVVALVAATLFLRTHIHPISPNDGQEIAGFCFFATLVMLFNGIAELSMSVSLFCPDLCLVRLQMHSCCNLCHPANMLNCPQFGACSHGLHMCNSSKNHY